MIEAVRKGARVTTNQEKRRVLQLISGAASATGTSGSGVVTPQ
jgi:hypothetical protein